MWARSHRLAVTLTGAAALVIGGAVGGAASAAAATGHVHPGSTVTVANNTCEVGFLLRHRTKAYATVPASCLGTDGGAGGNGCREGQAPNGSPARITGAIHRAHVVYSSFVRMQERGTTSKDKCRGNNISLLKLDKRDARRARGEIPGPASLNGLAHSPPASGTTLGIYLAAPASGQAGSTGGGHWKQHVTVQGMVSASNLGAPAVTPAGKAVGMISQIPPVTGIGTSQITSLVKELRFLRHDHRFRHVRLMTR